MPQDKVSRFVEAINQEAEKRKAQIIQETDEYIRRETSKAENEILEESYSAIQQKIASLREEIGREMSQKELESRKQLFLKRQQIADEVFSAAKQRLLSYSQTEAYPEWLRKSALNISELIQDEKIEMFLCQKDLHYKDMLKNIDGRIEIQTDAGILIGGLRACNARHSMILDDTLDHRLEHQRKWFIENAGLTIS